MGSQAAHFWPLLLFGLLGQALAVRFLLRGRPYEFFPAQFAAGWLALEAAAAAGWPWLTFLGAALFVPLIWPFARSQTRVLTVLTGFALVALGSTLVALSLRASTEPSLVPAPVVLDRWEAAHPLRVTRPPSTAFMLKQRAFNARVLDWFGEIRFDWPLMGGEDEIEVALENVGPLDSLVVIEGMVEIVPGSRNRALLRCGFSASGGTCRLQFRTWASPTRLALFGGTAGDLQLIEAVSSSLQRVKPDAIIALGDLIRPGDYAGLLAARDAIDKVGSRAVFLPGEAERAGPLDKGFAAVLGSADRVASIAGLSAVIADTSSGTTNIHEMPHVLVLAAITGQLGPRVLFLHHPLVAPPGREGVLLPDRAARAALLKRCRDWGVALVAATAQGESYEIEEEGVRHIVVGSSSGHADVAHVTIEQWSVRAISIETVSAPSSSEIGSTMLRWRAVAEEHGALGRILALGLAGIAGGLSLGATLGTRAFLERKKDGRDERSRGAGNGIK